MSILSNFPRLPLARFAAQTLLSMVQQRENTTTPSRVWLITGAARGLGRAFLEAALFSGDRVVGLARDITPLEELVSQYQEQLLALSVDITLRESVFRAVTQAKEHFGRIDIVVNNAGQFLFGMLEEVTEQQARAHMEVNFFGALWVCQAVVPLMRAQGAGHILQVTSMGAGVGFASVGMYGASKSALDAMSEALAMEVEGFNVQVTILLPGGYTTDLFTRGTTTTQENPAYASLREKLAELWGASYEAEPEKAAQVVLQVVNMASPPKRLILGNVAFEQVQQLLQARKEAYDSSESLSRRAG